MTDLRESEGRIIDAALKLAAEKPWPHVTLREIAEAAGTDLVTLRKSFDGKASIIAAYARRIDDEVLSTAPPPQAEQSTRDALFEVIMSRFDAMEPQRDALRSIAEESLPDAALIRPFMASVAWMLHAAGINTDGLTGSARVAGLAALYSSVFATWLNDDDPGRARTMAALDRRLRGGERAIEAFDQVSSFGQSVFDVLRQTVRRRTGPNQNDSAYNNNRPGQDGSAPYTSGPQH